MGKFLMDFLFGVVQDFFVKCGKLFACLERALFFGVQNSDQRNDPAGVVTVEDFGIGSLSEVGIVDPFNFLCCRMFDDVDDFVFSHEFPYVDFISVYRDIDCCIAIV